MSGEKDVRTRVDLVWLKKRYRRERMSSTEKKKRKNVWRNKKDAFYFKW